tara:strand:+ start:33 stop:1136 length:1104 start_codon:yes stop_codon:yes gene_type:complete
MSYIGKEPIVGNFQKCDAITTSSTATYNLTVSSVAVFPETTNNCIVSLNGVIQAPTSAYTISGSQIVFASSLTSSDVIDFILILGSVLNVGTVSDATITDAKANFVSTSSAAGLQIKGDGTTDGTLQLNCSQNSHGIKLKSPPHSASASYTLTFPNNDGDANQFLQTNGSGVLSFAAAGGAWTKIKTITLSGSTSSVIFLNGSSDVVIDNTYSTYKVIWNGVSGYDSTDSIMYAQVYDGGTDGSGTSLDTGSNYTYGTRSYDNHSTIIYSYALGASYMKLYTKAIDNQALRGYAGEFTAYNVNQVSADICTKFFRLAGISNDAADGYAMHNSMVGTWENAADTVRGFKFYPSAGTFGRGEFILYGIK